MKCREGEKRASFR